MIRDLNLNSANLSQEILDALEKLKRGLEGFEQREHQLLMLNAVDDVINHGGFLAVKAGTGTGKSFGYLIPAILAAEKGKKILIVTSSKALQDQLCDKDLPTLATYLNSDIKFRTLKGRSNYLCLQKVKELKDSANQGKLFSSQEAKQFQDIFQDILKFAETTQDGENMKFDASIWKKVSTDAEECPKKKDCPSGESCFFEKARDDAYSSNIVILNSHLFATDLDHSKGIVPDYDVLIIDEAHNLEDVVRSISAVELSSYKLRQAVNLISPLGLKTEVRNRCIGNLQSCSRLINDIFEEKKEQLKTNSNQIEIDLNSDKSIIKLLERLGEVYDLITQDIVSIESFDNYSSETEPLKKRALVYFDHLINELNIIRTNDTNRVCWAESTQHGPIFKVVIIDISDHLKSALWDTLELNNTSVVLTSATIFDWTLSRLGLPDATRFIDLGNPYETSDNALVFCPRDDYFHPKHQEYEAAKTSIICELISIAGGRTLLLCTSLKETERLGGDLKDIFKKRGINVLVQNSGKSNQSLLEEFKSDETSVLVGSYTFFEGIDVPGSSLSLVIIDKLPFLYPDLLIKKREEAVNSRGGHGFYEVQLSDALVRLAQGKGRLIRDAKDKGVIAILDNRIHDSSYSAKLREVFEPLKVVSDINEVKKFFESILVTKH